MSAWTNFKEHIRRRLLIGLVIVAPFGLTLFIVAKIIAFGMTLLLRPSSGILRRLLEDYAPAVYARLYIDGHFVWWVNVAVFAISLCATIALIYTTGLLSATLIGRKYIAAGEKMLKRIPGALFCYNTIKQVTEIISMPRSRAFQKVVLIEYPRQDVWGLAFFTGLTRIGESGKIMVNVFIPTTPNPTSGFLLLLPVDQVRETNLTTAEATRFVISGGVVSLDNLHTRPFPIADYLSQKAQTTASPANEKTPTIHPEETPKS